VKYFILAGGPFHTDGCEDKLHLNLPWAAPKETLYFIFKDSIKTSKLTHDKKKN